MSEIPWCKFSYSKVLSFSCASTRPGSLTKLIHQHYTSVLSQHSYFSRLARTWNSLSAIHLSLTLPAIKIQLSEFIWSPFLTHFDSTQPCTFHFVCACSRCHQVPIKVNFLSVLLSSFLCSFVSNVRTPFSFSLHVSSVFHKLMLHIHS